MNKSQLNAFLSNRIVLYLGFEFQFSEIEAPTKEIQFDFLDMTSADQWHYLMLLIVDPMNPYEDLGDMIDTYVNNFIMSVLVNQGVDLTPEYLKAIGGNEKSNVIRFPVKLRILK